MAEGDHRLSALNQYVKTLLDANDILFDLALRGEIANFVQNARSGHCYFSLRDASASVKAVMFRSDARRLGFRPEEGMKVVVRCRATLYERDGAFQIYVNEMFPDGIGAAQLAFEQLKAKLEQEGLLRQSTKSRCPRIPMHRHRHQQDRRGIAGHSQCHWPALACGKNSCSARSMCRALRRRSRLQMPLESWTKAAGQTKSS